MKEKIGSHRAPKTYPKFGQIRQTFIKPNRTSSALFFFFPLSPRYFLVENQLFELQFTVHAFRWTQIGTSLGILSAGFDCWLQTEGHHWKQIHHKSKRLEGKAARQGQAYRLNARTKTHSCEELKFWLKSQKISSFGTTSHLYFKYEQAFRYFVLNLLNS